MEFKLIVAGGRDFSDHNLFEREMNHIRKYVLFDSDLCIITGMAKGADLMAWNYAKDNNIRCYEFPAYWHTFGKRAGFKRNVEMANFSDALIAFWDGESRGTKHMIHTMSKMNKPIIVIYYEGQHDYDILVERKAL